MGGASSGLRGCSGARPVAVAAASPAPASEPPLLPESGAPAGDAAAGLPPDTAAGAAARSDNASAPPNVGATATSTAAATTAAAPPGGLQRVDSAPAYSASMWSLPSTAFTSTLTLEQARATEQSEQAEQGLQDEQGFQDEAYALDAEDEGLVVTVGDTKYSMRMLRQIFRQFDEDGSGSLTIDELDEVLKGLYRPTPDEIQKFVHGFSLNADNSISWLQFKLGLQKMNPVYKKPRNEIVIRALFKKYDTDGSEKLDGNELVLASRDLLQINPVMKKKVMMLFDENGDGEISFKEFKRIIQRLRGDLTLLWTAQRHATENKKRRTSVT